MRLAAIATVAMFLAVAGARGQDLASVPGAASPAPAAADARGAATPTDSPAPGTDPASRPFSRLFAGPDGSGPPRGEAGDPASPPDAGAGARAGGGNSISSNPAAVNILSGTGRLGRLLGLSDDSGVRVGGLWIGDASGVLAGGRSPGR